MQTRIDDAVRFAADRFRSPAELDIFVHAFRSGPCSIDDLARLSGLRISHAEQVAERLVTSGSVDRSPRGYEVAAGLGAEAAMVSAVFGQYRHRLVDAVVSADD